MSIEEGNVAKRQSFSDFLTNLNQPMPLPEKLYKLTRNLWRRVVPKGWFYNVMITGVKPS